MTEDGTWIILVIDGDTASSNVRMKAALEQTIREHNARQGRGKLLLWGVACMGHILMGSIVKTFKYSQLIPRCYALNVTFRFPPHYNKLVVLLRHKFEKDFLRGGYVANAGEHPMSGQWAQRTERVLSFTLLRTIRTRGRDAVRPGRNEDLLCSIFGVLRTMLTADINQSMAGHLCRGCCGGPRDAAMKLADAMVSGHVEEIAGKPPSTAKFYTLEEVKTSLCGFYMIHKCGPELLPIAIGHVREENNDGVALDDEAAEFRARCNRKARQAKEASTDETFNFEVVVSTWAGEPCEALCNQLQHKEVAGKCALDLTWERGPLHVAETELVKRLTSDPSSDFGLDFVMETFAESHSELELVDLELQAFASGMDVLAQLVSRVVMVAAEEPWDLLRLCDERYDIDGPTNK